jgi:hypothetical protein
MFGAFRFGQPNFAQGTAQGAAAQLVATATFSIAVSAAPPTGVSAPLAASATVSIAASAALTKPAATLAASATILFSTSVGFTKLPAALAAAATLRVSTSATLQLPTAAALAAAATVPFSTVATLTTHPAGLTRTCVGPFPIDQTVSPLAWAAAPAPVIAPARAQPAAPRAVPIIRTPRPPSPPIPARTLAPAERVCARALPIDPGYSPLGWLDALANPTDGRS